jgi:ABC-type transport system substrate-binding protein
VWQFGLSESVIDERMLADSGDDKNAVVYGGILPENLQTVFSNDALKDRRTDGFDGYVTYTMLNVSSIPCLEVRQAIWLAVDREALRTAAGGPFTGEYAQSFVAPLLTTDYAPRSIPRPLMLAYVLIMPTPIPGRSSLLYGLTRLVQPASRSLTMQLKPPSTTPASTVIRVI